MISNCINDFLPQISTFTWNYSETSHGKGAPDGIGGTLKRTADRLVAEGKDVENFETLVSAIKNQCPGVKIIEVTAEEINNIDSYFKNKTIYSFKGTRNVHQVVYKKERKSLNFRSLSCFQCLNKCIHFSLGDGVQRADNIKSNMPPLGIAKEIPTLSSENMYNKGM